MVNQKVKAFGFLLGAGLLSGFFLTSGSARWLNKPKPMVAAAQEQPADDSGQQGGKGDDKKKKRGAIEHEEGNASGSGDQGNKKKGRQAAAKSDQDESGGNGDTEMAEKTAAPPKQPAVAGGRLSGDQAVAFLAGNTMQLVSRDIKAMAYVSHSGWKGDLTEDGGLVVHRLVAGGGRLCEVGNNDGLVCQTLWVDAEAKPRAEAGAKLGTVTVLGGKTWTLLRGNVAAMPEFIPLLDAHIKPVIRPVPKLASATGKEALSALFQHALLADGTGDGVRSYLYDPDGRWIEMVPLLPGARDGLAGVKVQIGHWSYAKDTLCLDPPGLELNRKCFKPEQWGDGAFMLVPSVKGPPSKLLVLANNDAK